MRSETQDNDRTLQTRKYTHNITNRLCRTRRHCRFSRLETLPRAELARKNCEVWLSVLVVSHNLYNVSWEKNIAVSDK